MCAGVGCWGACGSGLGGLSAAPPALMSDTNVPQRGGLSEGRLPFIGHQQGMGTSAHGPHTDHDPSAVRPVRPDPRCQAPGRDRWGEGRGAGPASGEVWGRGGQGRNGKWSEWVSEWVTAEPWPPAALREVGECVSVGGGGGVLEGLDSLGTDGRREGGRSPRDPLPWTPPLPPPKPPGLGGGECWKTWDVGRGTPPLRERGGFGRGCSRFRAVVPSGEAA